MFGPLVLPMPTVAAVLAALGVAAYAYRRYLENTPNPWAGQPWAAPPAGGRHRLTAATPPYRDWAALAAERMAEEQRRAVLPAGVADYRQPLTDFERAAGVLPPVVAGLDTWDDETQQLNAIRLAFDETDTVVLSPVS